MVDGVEDVAVRRDALVVVEVVERLLEEEDEGRFGSCGLNTEGREDVGTLSPSSRRSQPRGVGDGLQ